jgi:hypothetical protein
MAVPHRNRFRDAWVVRVRQTRARQQKLGVVLRSQFEAVLTEPLPREFLMLLQELDGKSDLRGEEPGSSLARGPAGSRV